MKLNSQSYSIRSTITAFKVFLFVFFAGVSAGFSASQTWDNGAANSTWDTVSLNWDSGLTYTSGNDASFGATGAGAITVNGTLSVGNITNNAPGYTFSGGTLDNFKKNGIVTWTFNNDTTLSSTQTLSYTSSAGTFNKTGAGKLTIAGTVLGTGYSPTTATQWRINSGSTLELIAGSSFTLTNSLFRVNGNTTISGGTHQFLGNSAHGIAVGDTLNTVLTVSGGSIYTVKLSLGFASSSTYIQSGGTVTVGSDAFAVILGSTGASTTTSTLNLDGGILAARQIAINTNGTWLGTATINLNGGIFRANGVASSYGGNIFSTTNAGNPNLGNIFVKAGGAIIDSAGYTITSGQALQADPVSTGGGLTKLGAGILTIVNNDNTYIGTTTVSNGLIKLSAPETGGSSGPLGNPATLANSIVLSCGGLQFSANNKYDDTTSGRLQLADGATGIIDDGGQSVIFANPIGVGAAATGALTKQGSGTLTLSAANTYKGVTTISAGNLVIANDNALGTTDGNTTFTATGLSGGPTLTLSNNITCPENITITGLTEQTSGFRRAIDNNNGNNTLSGNITLSNLTGGMRLGATAGSLTFAGTISQTGSSSNLVLNVAGSSSVTVNNAIANNGGSLTTSGTAQTGTGVVQLNAASGSGIGDVTVLQASTLRLGVDTALNTGAGLTIGANNSVAGQDTGTVDLNGKNLTVDALIGLQGTYTSPSNNTFRVVKSGVSGTVTLTVGTAGGTGTFNGVIIDGSGTVSLVKAGSGTETLAGANTYTGNTTISAGTLALGVNSALSASTAVTLGAATLDAQTFTNSVGTLDVTNAATINLGSGGTLVFADSHLKSWSGGTLNITGTFVPGSSIRFGTDASGLTTAQKNAITVNGSGAGTYGLDSSGYLVVTPTTLYQPVLSSANLVNGGLVLQFSGTNGQSYKILSSTNLSVAFSNWTAVSSGTLTGSTINYTNTPTTDPQRFFIITSP